MEKKKEGFSGSLGFILATAGSAVGLGNIWRFPYLAAKDGGGIFLLVYVLLAVTFGFAMMATEIAIGRKTGLNPLQAYGKLEKRFSFIGVLAIIAPMLILPYYCVIGGWVTKYAFSFISGQSAVIESVGSETFFTDFISNTTTPVIWFLVFLAATSLVVVLGVEKGIEKMSKILMPALVILILGIAVYSLTLSHTDADTGTTRTALDGLKIYLIPDFQNMTADKLLSVIADASSQMFYSMSIAMGILVTYGSYANKSDNLLKSVGRIEWFDTGVAFVAGLIIIPAVFAFQGSDGLNQAGPGLLFISLPDIFRQMGFVGNIVGALFFFMVFFAALTSSISIMETLVSSFKAKFNMSRRKTALIVFIISLVIGVVVCFGYNIFYFDATLPNGSTGQILDILDFVSNSVFLPIVALLTCLLIGWIYKPKGIIDELKLGISNAKFRREKIYIFMVKYGAPILMVVILLQAFGVLQFN